MKFQTCEKTRHQRAFIRIVILDQILVAQCLSQAKKQDLTYSKTYGPQLTDKQKSIHSDTLNSKKMQVKSTYDNKNRFLCQFCGGKGCKHEDWTQCKRPAIKGLNSNWINNDIVASQRLSARLIKEYDIVAQMKELKLGTIINLQEPGEHQHCGDGVIEKVGFSYDYEELQKCTCGYKP